MLCYIKTYQRKRIYKSYKEKLIQWVSINIFLYILVNILGLHRFSKIDR